MHRRQFIAVTSGTIAASYIGAMPSATASAPPRYRAVVFDGFPIFDPRPIFATAEALFPGKGAELSGLWRTKQFEYTWLRTLENRYVDFAQVTNDALSFATRSMNIELSHDNRERLMQGYFALKAWPDVIAALDALKRAGVRLGMLTNFSETMLATNVKNANLGAYFEALLSTDKVRAYKPAPKAYEMGPHAFGLPKEHIVFAAFAGWDAAGAKAFGYPTFWVNRQNAPAEELGDAADAAGSMADLVKFVFPETSPL